MRDDDRVTIATATEADAAWCARLMVSSDPWITLERDEAACEAALQRPGSVTLVARRDPDRLGFVLVAPAGVAGSPYVASIAVAPGARGQGVGGLLLDAAEKVVPGARNIFLCVSDFNTRARALYERRGYQQVGVLDDYIVEGHAEILMRKRLR